MISGFTHQFIFTWVIYSGNIFSTIKLVGCLLYTSDAADDKARVDLGGRRVIKKKKKKKKRDV
ncbi:hypothetical protein SUT007_09530 [Streptococcus parasuis]|nr:hypothetical protein SUT007_09530 [Streptococcus parasuis]